MVNKEYFLNFFLNICMFDGTFVKPFETLIKNTCHGA